MIQKFSQRSQVLRINQIELIRKVEEVAETELELVSEVETVDERDVTVVNVLVNTEQSTEDTRDLRKIITGKRNVYGITERNNVLGSIGKRESS